MGHEGFLCRVQKSFFPCNLITREGLVNAALTIHAKRYLQKGFSKLFAKSEVKRLFIC